MKIPKLKVGDKVLVEWIDSFTPNHSDWMDGEGLDDHLRTNLAILTLGFYVGQDKRFLHLCATVGMADGEISGYLNPLTIPVGCIEKVKKL